ncbi:MAG TPA: hypothetical protein VGD69_27350 [Herpetosiphonaceae bacterium]
MSSTIDRSRHDSLIAEGREALHAGDKARAQELLQTAVRLDPHSEEAWLWLSGVFTAPDDMAECLQRVLEINPHNEQAQEGLRWLAAEHGLAIATPEPIEPEPAHEPAHEPVTIVEPVRLHPPQVSSYSSGLLLESALHPAAAGVWLGLFRLLGWLRPETLRLMRGAEGGLGWGGSLGVALAAALLHGLALGVVWLLTGWQLSRVRATDRGDLFDSLVRASQLWVPAYLWLGAVIMAALALNLSPGPWRIAVGACWLLLLAGAALIGRRLWRLLDAVGLRGPQRSRSAARLVVILVLGGVLSLGLAGIATAALLR